MRLIDADALQIALIRKYDEVADLLEIVDKQPTAFDKDKFYLFLNNWAFAASPNGWEDNRTREIKQTKVDTIHEVMQALDDLK